MKKIKELTIQEEQELQLKILKTFNKACEENQIDYFAAYGTLLGAVRDKGFIKWDDDIDIWMTRDSIIKFKKIFYNYFDESEYFYQDDETDKNSVIPEIVRICVYNTYKWPNGCENEKFNKGVYFDIFPLDNGFANDKDKKILSRMTQKHSRLYSTIYSSNNKSIKDILKKILMIVFPRRSIRRKILQLIASLKDNPKSQTFVCLPASYGGVKGSLFKSSYFDETIWMDFEDTRIKCPLCYDELLKQIYGNDYMTPKRTKQGLTKAYITIGE
ncbi:MAG: LicD family protein [Clostridiales bacterium]|nr:LicD family protein [Clostridiales bacterium]